MTEQVKSLSLERGTNGTLQAENGSLKQENSSLLLAAAENADLREKYQEATSALAALRVQKLDIERKQLRIESLESSITDSQEEVAALKAEKTSFQSQLDTSKAQNQVAIEYLESRQQSQQIAPCHIQGEAQSRSCCCHVLEAKI